MVRNGLFSLFLLTAAWQDGWKKEIPVWIFWAGGMAALVLSGWQTAYVLSHGTEDGWLILWIECVAGSLPGIVLLLCGRLTGGAIGSGDGWFFLVSGWFLGLKNTALLLCGSILLCGVWALGLLCWKYICGNVYVGKTTLPFLPFAGLSWLGLLAVGWIAE